MAYRLCIYAVWDMGQCIVHFWYGWRIYSHDVGANKEMIKSIVLSVLLLSSLRGESLFSESYDTEIVKMCIIEYTFNDYEYSKLTEMYTKCITPEARRRGGKGDKKRRRGGNGLR